MKSIVILFVCVFVACLVLETTADCPSYDNPHSESRVKEGETVEKDCAIFTCKDGAWSSSGCSTWQCPEGQQISYKKQDNTKPYPECCPGPICKSSSP